MIDLHTHVLPALDDGVESLDEAIDLCRAAGAAGVTVIAATPHVRYDYPTTPASMRAALERVAAATAEIGVRVLPGGELALEELARPVAELREFGLAGNPDVLLVETPYAGWPLDMGNRLATLQAAGIVPVLAHPERNPEVQRHPGLVARLVDDGTLVQITAASLAGRIGRDPRRAAVELIDAGHAHLLATDAHHAGRMSELVEAARQLGNEALARWLTVDVPAAIVERRRLPLRPAPPASSGWRRWLRR